MYSSKRRLKPLFILNLPPVVAHDHHQFVRNVVAPSAKSIQTSIRSTPRPVTAHPH